MSELYNIEILQDVLLILFYIFVLLSVVGVSFLAGFVSANLTKWLDAAMSYRGIFENWRRNAAKKYDFNIDFTEVHEQNTFEESEEVLESIYWTLVVRKKGFMVWMCQTCISTRINLFVSFIVMGLLFLTFGFAWIFLMIPIVSLAANQYYL